jgi:hypothetical protein
LRELSRSTGELLWKFPNGLVKVAKPMSFLWLRPSTDQLQGAAITKEQAPMTLQRCLKILWTRLPNYTISQQDLARINNTYEGAGP